MRLSCSCGGLCIQLTPVPGVAWPWTRRLGHHSSCKPFCRPKRAGQHTELSAPPKGSCPEEKCPSTRAHGSSGLRGSWRSTKRRAGCKQPVDWPASKGMAPWPPPHVPNPTSCLPQELAALAANPRKVSECEYVCRAAGPAAIVTKGRKGVAGGHPARLLQLLTPAGVPKVLQRQFKPSIWDHA